MKQQANGEYMRTKNTAEQLRARKQVVCKRSSEAALSRDYTIIKTQIASWFEDFGCETEEGVLVCHLLQEGGKQAVKEKVSNFRRSSTRACECKRA